MKRALLTLALTSLLATTALADPIHVAARVGDLAGVQAELDKGVDVNVKDRFGFTPLREAAWYGHKEIVELLLDKGVNVNAKDEDGWTPLHFAVTKEIAELFIAEGADVTAKNKWGGTTLQYAARRGYKEVVELLIAEGADVNAQDDDGETPPNRAEEEKHKEIIDLLRKHGGKSGEELALMPRLEYGKDQWPFSLSFTTKGGETYVVEVTQDIKQWGELETVEGTGKRVKFIDPRQPLVPFKRNFYRVKLVE